MLENLTPRKVVLFIVILIALIFGLTTISGSWYTVDEGEVGVVTRNGAIASVASAGLGFKLPFIDDVNRITMRSELVTFPNLQAYSKDQQTAHMKVSVNYHLVREEAKSIYSVFGSANAVAERLIYPRVNEELKTVFGNFTAVSAIQEREKLNAQVFEIIHKNVTGVVVIESVQIENIDFSDIYEQNIEARMTAEVEVQKLRQQAEQAKVKAEITVTAAQAAADSQRRTADGNSYATVKNAEADAAGQRLIGEAQAAAIKAKGDAIRENPALIQLITAERWSGVLPTTMVPGGGVPLLPIK